jgi:uroporphyrinogen decarboxylase
MNYRERLIKLLNGKKVDRPPFMPAIYDLKPVLINASPYSFGQNIKELIQALTYEAEELKLESLTVAYDIYNIEAEAIGCKISRNPAIGMPEITEPIIQSIDEIIKLQELYEISGRMPLFVQTTKKIQQMYGDVLPVRVGISGPFSMAAKIYPQSNLLMETILNTEGIKELLRYCTKTIRLYTEACIKTGAGVIIFDSFVSPPMISPETYRELVFPFHQELFKLLQENNVLQRSLIVGGNTTSLIPDFVKTGATQLLLDYNIPLNESKEILQQYKEMVFRINLPPALFINLDTSELKLYIENVLYTLQECPNLIVGTGILPPNVPPGNILKAKETIVDFYK